MSSARPIKTAAIYTRVSKKDQDAEGQLQQLRKFARRQGWRIAAEFIDHESGASSTRPQFHAMMRAAAQQSFDCVLFWSLDRFSREGLLQTLQYFEQLNHYGIAWWNFQHPDMSGRGTQAKVFLAVSAIWAEMERQFISERTKAALQVARSRGVKLGRPRVTVDSTRIRSLKAQGLTPAAIAKKLRVSRSTVIRRLLTP